MIWKMVLSLTLLSLLDFHSSFPSLPLLYILLSFFSLPSTHLSLSLSQIFFSHIFYITLAPSLDFFLSTDFFSFFYVCSLHHFIFPFFPSLLRHKNFLLCRVAISVDTDKRSVSYVSGGIYLYTKEVGSPCRVRIYEIVMRSGMHGWLVRSFMQSLCPR